MGLGTASQWLLCATLMVALCQGQEDETDCPQKCRCKWVSSKKTAECTNLDLKEVPKSLSSDIQFLDITGNPIIHLVHDVFNRSNMLNLQKLAMRHCELEAIHSTAFDDLKIIIEIDLSHNSISVLQPNTFSETAKLRVLLLNHNLLTRLENGLFSNLTFLQKVELSNNRLEYIGEKTFQNLPALQTLLLNENNLRTLQLQNFQNLPKISSLELRNNPWNCDCELKSFRDWSIRRKLYTKPTKCREPARMADKMWDEVASDEFACPPSIVYVGPATKVEMGKGDVTLSCKALGVPQPKLAWVYRKSVLKRDSKRPSNERGYMFTASRDSSWLNLTIVDATASDKGDYICNARNLGGVDERNVTLVFLNDSGRYGAMSLPLMIGLVVTALCLLMVAVVLCLCYCRRNQTGHDEKGLEAASLEHHGLGEQEKSLITTINPVVKPPRRYEASSVASHGTEMTELNRTLLDNDSVFADGSGVVCGVSGGLGDDDRDHERATPELDRSGGGGGGGGSGSGGSGGGGGGGNGTLPRGGNAGYHHRQYPPDLLAFSGGRGASPTSQASTLPDSTRIPNHQATPTVTAPSAAYGSPPSLAPGQYHPAAFKTLPHSRSVTPFGMGPSSSSSSPMVPVLPRHGYVTIPRRPRAPSWSSCPPTSSPTSEVLDPVYDNLGLRTTADGSSVLSLNKTLDPASMRGRPLPSTPGSHYGTIQRSTPNILAGSGPLDRAAPEGAAEWPIKLPDESAEGADYQQQQLAQQQQQQQQPNPSNTLGRKIPPRPPPKPKKKSSNGPTLYEDEGEDGTEV